MGPLTHSGALMSLSDLASLGSFVSGVAVLASLVFLYFQLRQIGLQVKQAEKNQQASIRQARVTRGVEMLRANQTDPLFLEAQTKLITGMYEKVELPQYYSFRTFANCRFLPAEDSF